MSVRVQISFRNSATGADDWLDITDYLAKQWPLPEDFGANHMGVYPDVTDAAQSGSDHWYDLREAIFQAANDLAIQAGVELKNVGVRGQNSMGDGPQATATRRAEDVKNFFDGRIHAMRIICSNGGDPAGTDIRLLFEYRYTSRNA